MEQLAGLTEGRIVHYVMPNGKHRPAIVVQVWNRDKGEANLQVFLDGTNDTQNGWPGFHTSPAWIGTVAYSENFLCGTWHWPERKEA